MPASTIENVLQIVAPPRGGGDAPARSDEPFGVVLERTTRDRTPVTGANQTRQRSEPTAAARDAGPPNDATAGTGEQDETAHHPPAEAAEIDDASAAATEETEEEEAKQPDADGEAPEKDDATISAEAAAAAAAAVPSDPAAANQAASAADDPAALVVDADAAAESGEDAAEGQRDHAAAGRESELNAEVPAGRDHAAADAESSPLVDADSLAKDDAGGKPGEGDQASQTEAGSAMSPPTGADGAAAAAASADASHQPLGELDQQPDSAATSRSNDAGAVATQANQQDSGGATDQDGQSRQQRATTAVNDVGVGDDPVRSAAPLTTTGAAAVDSETPAAANEATVTSADAVAAVSAGDAVGRGATSPLDRIGLPRGVGAPPPQHADGDLPGVDRGRFLQRVGGAVRMAEQGDGRVRVRLAPPELGSLKIELAVQNGVLHAKLETETPAARTLLLDNLPALRQRLAEQDIRIETFDVDVRQDGGGRGQEAPHDRQSPWREPHANQQRRDQRASGDSKTPTPGSSPAGRQESADANDGLDVRV